MILCMDELWQLYTDKGIALPDQGGTKTDIFGQGLLHGASHVWIWRHQNNAKQILVQKRATTKHTWPNKYDISAAGHIDLGETPLQAAIRETKEEIGIDIAAKNLHQVSLHRSHLVASNGAIENELQWVYLLKLPGSAKFTLQKSEISSVEG